jgi:hypothetical protein
MCFQSHTIPHTADARTINPSQCARILNAVEGIVRIVIGTVAAENAHQILRERRARHDHITTGFHSFDLEITLNVGNKADDGRGFLVLGTHFGDDRQRLDAIAIEVNDDQRRLFFRTFSLFRDVLIAFDELDLHVELARDFLNFGHEEKIVDEGKDLCGRVHALGERFHVGTGLSAIVETRSLHGVAIALVAIAMVHWPHKARSAAPLSATAAIVAVLAILPAGATLIAGPILAVLAVLAVLAGVLRAKIPSPPPRLTIARVLRILRLVQSFIHSYTCEL